MTCTRCARVRRRSKCSSPESTQFQAATRTEVLGPEKRRLGEAIPNAPDLLCEWQIWLQSANPRANHTLGTLPLLMSVDYRHAHDEGIWNVACVLSEKILGTAEEVKELRKWWFAAHARGWSRAEVGSPYRGGGLLGFVGRCDEHDRPRESGCRESSSGIFVPPPEKCSVKLQRARDRMDREGFWCRLGTLRRASRLATLAR